MKERFELVYLQHDEKMQEDDLLLMEKHDGHRAEWMKQDGRKFVTDDVGPIVRRPLKPEAVKAEPTGYGRSVRFKHDIGDDVKILAIGMIGKIDALIYGLNAEQYRVVYWNDGHRQDVWMYDWEIDRVLDLVRTPSLRPVSMA